MDRMAVTWPALDYRDMQGLVRFGYKHLRAARYAMVRIRDPPAARAWHLHAPVTSADYVQPPPPWALHVALSASGLAALGVPDGVRAAFSPEFLGGMADEARARRLGDVGANDPAGWRWGG